jgi:hypothetical protein
VLSQDVIDKTIAEFKSGRTYGGRDPSVWHFDALKRMLDRTEPDYKN